MTARTIEWKYDVGDFVMPKIMRRSYEAKLPPSKREKWETSLVHGRPALVGQIVSRLAEECSGGVQLFYSVRWTDGGGVRPGADRVFEMELDPWEPAVDEEEEA